MEKKVNVLHHGLALLNVYLESTTAFFESKNGKNDL